MIFTLLASIPPLDVSSTGADIATWVGRGAVAGALVWSAVLAVKYIVRAFKSVK